LAWINSTFVLIFSTKTGPRRTRKRGSAAFLFGNADKKNNTLFSVCFLLTKGRQNDMFRHLLNEYSIVFLQP
jgi:hypothetical protein